jgi:hypothetical protein
VAERWTNPMQDKLTMTSIPTSTEYSTGLGPSSPLSSFDSVFRIDCIDVLLGSSIDVERFKTESNQIGNQNRQMHAKRRIRKRNASVGSLKESF